MQMIYISSLNLKMLYFSCGCSQLSFLFLGVTLMNTTINRSRGCERNGEAIWYLEDSKLSPIFLSSSNSNVLKSIKLCMTN